MSINLITIKIKRIINHEIHISPISEKREVLPHDGILNFNKKKPA